MSASKFSASINMEKKTKFMCRACALTTYCISIFSEEGEALDLHSKIRSCFGVNVLRNDRYPKHICFGCIGKLSIFEELRQKSESAQAFIHTTFGHNLPCVIELRPAEIETIVLDKDEPPADEIETIVLDHSFHSASTISIHLSDHE